MPRRRALGSLQTVTSSVQSVDRALHLLEVLASAPGDVAVKDAARAAGLHVSTAHRLLTALMARGFVDQDRHTARYRLGPKAVEIGHAAAARWRDVRALARPELEELVRRHNETANLVLLHSDEAVYVDQVPSTHMIRMFTTIGTRVPLHCTGCGKAMLAFLPEAEVERIIQVKGLSRYTANTITDASCLRRELEMIRTRGYAIDNEEREEGVRCVAAPIFRHPDVVIGAISISGPASRLGEERVHQLGPELVEATQRISTALGAQAPSQTAATAAQSTPVS